MDMDKPHLVLVPDGGEIDLTAEDGEEPYTLVGRDDLDARMRGAIMGVAEWYRQAQAAVTEEESFYWGRQMYHAMRPIEALDRKLRGLPPEHPCTDCGTEEGGASSGPDGDGGRFSRCAWCAHAADGY